METETRGSVAPTSNRRSVFRKRLLALLVVVVFAGAMGLAVVDMVGHSDRETARIVGSEARASTAARDFGYVPSLILAPDALPLRVAVHNQGAHTHTFTIDSLGIDVLIQRGETKVVSLQPPRRGRFEFYCRFHQAYGMRGHIVVRSG